MKDERFMEAVDRICRDDRRYAPDSYEFISDAVTYTVKKLDRNKKPRGERHVNGKELVAGVAEYAVEQFGPLAKNVLSDWGLTSSLSIGNVVFNLIGANLLYASEEDRLEDFDGADALLQELLNASFEFAKGQEPGAAAPKTKPPIIE
jgi:uncharacterized repeat protein (TIGR04138 family)